MDIIYVSDYHDHNYINKKTANTCIWPLEFCTHLMSFDISTVISLFFFLPSILKESWHIGTKMFNIISILTLRNSIHYILVSVSLIV